MVQQGPFTPEWREVYTGKQSGMPRKTCQWLSILVLPSENGSPVMQGDVWPWATRSQQGLKKASRRLISALAMYRYTNGRSCHKLFNVTVYGWPPEVSLSEWEHTIITMVIYYLIIMNPVTNFTPYCSGNKEFTHRTGTWIRFISLSLPDVLLNAPREGANETAERKDDLLIGADLPQGWICKARNSGIPQHVGLCFIK